jgi:ribonuclease HI
LIAGLNIAKELGVKAIQIRGDSQLITDQIQANSEAKGAGLYPNKDSRGVEGRASTESDRGKREVESRFNRASLHPPLPSLLLDDTTGNWMLSQLFFENSQ